MEKRNNLDPSLITSDVCIKCQQCCYGHSYISQNLDIKNKALVHDMAEYASVAFQHEDSDVFVVKKDDNKVHFITNRACQKLDKEKGCTIYNKRPKVCSQFNCFERYNTGEKSWSVYFDKLEPIIKEVHNIDINLPKHWVKIPLKEII